VVAGPAGAAAPSAAPALTGRWTARGYGALVLGGTLLGLGLWWRYPGVAGLGLAFLLLTLGALVLMRVPVPVEVRRWATPLEVTRLGDCTGTLSVSNRGRRFPVLLDATETVVRERVPVFIPSLRPGGQTEVRYPIPTARHGLLPVGPLRLRRLGLAGLAEGTAVLPGVIEVRVRPRVLPIRGLPPGAKRGHVGAEEKVAHGGTDLVALREYLPGDDVRRLHWATSARTGALMVREDADPARPALTILLDDRSTSYPGDSGGDFEEAVDVAASLAGAARDAGHPAWLVTVGQGPVAGASTVHSGADGAELLDALAGVSASPLGTDPDPSLVPAYARDVVVAVTGTGADLAAVVLAVSRAEAAVVLVVDPLPDRTAATAGPVLVLRAPRAEELFYAWDLLVATAPATAPAVTRAGAR